MDSDQTSKMFEASTKVLQSIYEASITKYFDPPEMRPYRWRLKHETPMGTEEYRGFILHKIKQTYIPPEKPMPMEDDDMFAPWYIASQPNTKPTGLDSQNERFLWRYAKHTPKYGEKYSGTYSDLEQDIDLHLSREARASELKPLLDVLHDHPFSGYEFEEPDDKGYLEWAGRIDGLTKK
jgi:hypothetical protein